MPYAENFYVLLLKDKFTQNSSFTRNSFSVFFTNISLDKMYLHVLQVHVYSIS